jgi:exopolysaccharide biosynthesis polyprenyl glycosylphosphotransferase
MTSLLGSLAPGFTSKLNLAVDLVLLLAAIAFASLTGSQLMAESIWFASSAVAAWVVASTALRYYDPFAERDAFDDVALISVLSLAVVTLLALVGLIVPAKTAVPRVGPFLLAFWPAAVLVRLVVMRTLQKKERPMDDVLIVGTGPLGRVTGEDLQRGSRRRVLGYLSFPEDTSKGTLPAPLLGTLADLEKCLRTHAISEVYVAGSATRQGDVMQGAVKLCEKFGVPFALPAYSFRFDRARPASSKAIPDGYLHYLSMSSKPSQMALKRLFDILSSAVALWLLAPMFLVVALLIKLTSRGPVFFKQVRVGLHGRQFHMLKFRSMVVNAEELKAKLAAQNEQSGPVFKMKHDPRITRIGRFIRKYSIDELPQLINVLRGDMSVVGPRPPVPNEVAQYEPWQRRRLSVRPGLTCIWQVSGRNQISFEDWMYLDMRYIDHWSLTADFNLILKTVPVVLTGKGAS